MSGQANLRVSNPALDVAVARHAMLSGRGVVGGHRVASKVAAWENESVASFQAFGFKHSSRVRDPEASLVHIVYAQEAGLKDRPLIVGIALPSRASQAVINRLDTTPVWGYCSFAKF